MIPFAMPMVAVRDLRKQYGSVHAVDGVSFTIDEGEIFGLIGPNGAGKTTTVECVIGLRQPDGGEIQVCGIDARRSPRDVKQRIGAALQTVALQDQVTPREALWLFGGFYERRADTAALLERFGLTSKADVHFRTLSGGQRQRLALALAFVNDPALVFLDEPTAGLDAEVRRELRSAILQMKQDGHTVLLTTHDIEEAELLCDRIAIIDRGRVVATGTPRELVAGSTSMTTIRLTSSRPIPGDLIATLTGARDVTSDGATLALRTPDVTRTLAALTARLAADEIEITALHAEKASLEDVLLQMTTSAHTASREDR